MSNTLAIATVTATLRNVLQAALNAADPQVSSANVYSYNPSDKKGTVPYVNVFLYHVTPNAALRNVDLPTRSSNGDTMRKPQAALNLHYLISCVGDDDLFASQRMLGTVVSTLHSQSMLTRDIITQSISTVSTTAGLDFLNQSDLATAVDLVKLTPESLSTEEMSKIWSVLFQLPYLLSVSYVASVVLVDGVISPATALPVTSRGVYTLAGRRPVIEGVALMSDLTLPAYATPSPIIAGSALIIRGSNFSGDDVHVLSADFDVTIPQSANSGNRIEFVLPAVAAGVIGLQIAIRVPMGNPATAHRGSESNVFPIVVHPQATAVGKGPVTVTTIAGVNYDDTEITVTVSPDIGIEQRVSLMLNQRLPAPPAPANAYTFDAVPRVEGVDPPTAPTVKFKIKGVAEATYMVRVLVDGAESIPPGGIGTPYVDLVLP